MWLEAKRTCSLVHFEPNDLVIHCSVYMRVFPEEEPATELITVGRMLADELRRYDIAEKGESVWRAADADSSGLESAWASLLDEEGEFREEEFESNADSIVYLYRFKLHADFSDWRLAAMDAFCRTFGSDALILAQYHTTWFSEAEFELLGFRLLPETKFPSPAGFPNIDRDTLFMVRDNACQPSFGMNDYPEDAPDAKQEHAEWLEEQGPWDGLV